MSLKNHPNFHAVKFATDIMVSYVECLRGDAENLPKKYFKGIEIPVLQFIEAIENKVDCSVALHNVEQKNVGGK